MLSSHKGFWTCSDLTRSKCYHEPDPCLGIRLVGFFVVLQLHICLDVVLHLPRNSVSMRELNVAGYSPHVLDAV